MIGKIKSKEENQRRKRRNQIILGVVLIFILVASMLMMDSTKNNEKERVIENGVEFFRVDDFWQAQIDGTVFQFSFLPSELSNIEVKGVYSIADYFDRTAYFNDMNNEGAMEILINLERFIQRGQEACESENCERDLPTKTCDDIFFIFKEGENSSVQKNSSCVYITGDLRRGSDAFLYKALNI